MTFSTEWTENVSDPKRKKDLEEVVRNSSIVARRVLELCDKWEEEIIRAQCKSTDYDCPSWDVRQAARNGDLARIRKLKDLFSFVHGDK